MLVASGKRRFAGIFIFAGLIGLLTYGMSTGVTGVTRKNGTGCTCHGSASAAVTVTIAGPATLAIGQTGDYTVTVSGGPLSRAGTNIAASAGTLLNADNSLKVVNAELTHTSPKAPSGTSVSFAFKYTAPATTGAVTLYANGNSVNFNSASSGDQWNFAPNFTVNVTPATDVDDASPAHSFSLQQNYPNPFNPSTRITYSLTDESNVSLRVFSANGEEVITLVNSRQSAGEHSVDFNANGLAAGMYLYKLQTEQFVSIKKMILSK
jgi:hypothetical protein